MSFMFPKFSTKSVFMRRAALPAVTLCAGAAALGAAFLLLHSAVGDEHSPASLSRAVPITAVALAGDAASEPMLATLAVGSAADPTVYTAVRYTLAVDRFASAQLEAFAVPGWQSQMYKVTYASSDEAVAAVAAAGLVTGVSAGEAVITATATDATGTQVSAQCFVTVAEADPPITALTLVRSKVKLRMGGTGSNLTVTGCEPAAYAAYLTAAPAYESSDESVCTVDENGHITAVGEGEATVTATLYGVSAQCAVTVQDTQVQLSGGVNMLNFLWSDITSIGNQTAGRCSWYALRYARTILDGTVCAGSGMWSNGVIWSAGGYTDYSAGLGDCLNKIYSELSAGRPVIVHLQNTTVSAAKHANRVSTYEYWADGTGGWNIVEYPHIATSSYYGHWVCIVGYADSADPANLRESDFFALDPARVTSGGTLILTRLMDGTLWTSNSPLKLSR